MLFSGIEVLQAVNCDSSGSGLDFWVWLGWSCFSSLSPCPHPSYPSQSEPVLVPPALSSVLFAKLSLGGSGLLPPPLTRGLRRSAGQGRPWARSPTSALWLRRRRPHTAAWSWVLS